MDLVLRAAARPHQLRRDATAAGASPTCARSGIHTASSDPAASSLANVRASSRSVFARAWRIPVSDGLTTTHLRDMRLEDPRDLPRVAASPQAPPDHPGQGSRRTARAAPASSRSAQPSEPRPSSTIATSQKSRCTSNPTALTTHLLALGSNRTGEQWANDTDGFALEAQPGKSQGRPLKSPGSNSPSRKTGLPNMRSPRRPLSRSPDPSPAGTRTTALKRHSHAPKSERVARARPARPPDACFSSSPAVSGLTIGVLARAQERVRRSTR